jgi:CHRD domain
MKNALAIVLALVLAAVAAPTLAAAAGAAATTDRLSANMNTRQVVTPKNKPWKAPARVADAKGTFTGTFNRKTRKLRWRITYSGIGSRRLTLADVHNGPRGKFGAIIVRLCRDCKSGQKGVRKIKRSFVNAITSGNSWVTVITDKYPNGVIRGQIKVR